MGIPVIQQFRVGAYILKQKILGRKKYPLVLMLEPLFRCNLACAGCGKIDYPKEILNQSVNNYSSVKKHWNDMELDKRLEIFLTAADKIEGKYYNQLLAATIVSQNKTPYEAEIDAICELADFLRFNVDYVTQIYQKQPISPDGYSNISQYQPYFVISLMNGVWQKKKYLGQSLSLSLGRMKMKSSKWQMKVTMA